MYNITYTLIEDNAVVTRTFETLLEVHAFQFAFEGLIKDVLIEDAYKEPEKETISGGHLYMVTPFSVVDITDLPTTSLKTDPEDIARLVKCASKIGQSLKEGETFSCPILKIIH